MRSDWGSAGGRVVLQPSGGCLCNYTVLVLLQRDFVGNIIILSYAVLQHFVVLDD